jgi:hypothetical protein
MRGFRDKHRSSEDLNQLHEYHDAGWVLIKLTDDYDLLGFPNLLKRIIEPEVGNVGEGELRRRNVTRGLDLVHSLEFGGTRKRPQRLARETRDQARIIWGGWQLGVKKRRYRINSRDNIFVHDNPALFAIRLGLEREIDVEDKPIVLTTFYKLCQLWTRLEGELELLRRYHAF